MPTFLAFIHAGLQQASNNALEDGQQLAQRCLKRLDGLGDPEHFPPQLLILLASPAYKEPGKAAQLVAGVRQICLVGGLEDTPLIGSSVAAVFFDGHVHERGAVLVCLAGRHITARVAVAAVGGKPDDAVKKLMSALVEEYEEGGEPNPRGNRTLLAFFPGEACGHRPDVLHRLLQQGVMFRIPILGGVSSVNDPEHKEHGLQFAKEGVYTQSIAAAIVESAYPMPSSLSCGFERTKAVLHVKGISEGGRTVQFPQAASLAKLDKEKRGFVLFGHRRADSEAVVAVWIGGKAKSSARALRDISGGDELQVLRLNPGKIIDTAKEGLRRSCRRIRTENPIGCLLLWCVSHYRHRNSIGLNVQGTLKELGSWARGFPIVGGFVDGEVGVDETGRSTVLNWSSSALLFGDELRARGAGEIGFQAIARNPLLDRSGSPEEVLTRTVQIIREAGFPGAMISLVVEDGGEQYVKAQQASGPRFVRIVDMTRRPLSGDDILAVVVRDKKPEFVPDSRDCKRYQCDEEAVKASGLISQYVAPLFDLAGEALGVVQIDLGDSSYKQALRRAERELLDSLAAWVGGAVARAMASERDRITAALDDLLSRALTSSSVAQGLQQFITGAAVVFGADTAHIREFGQANCQRRLVLTAGTGEYHELATQYRKEIESTDMSRTGEAFQKDALIIVNDTENDATSRNLVERCKQDTAEEKQALAAEIARAKSCATFCFKTSAGEKAGTFTFHSYRPWFFHSARTACLRVLQPRVGFLFEHLRKKEDAARYNRGLEFLIQAGPQLTELSQIDDLSRALGEATTRFRTAADAHVVSLYLWHEGVRQFVLRAQDGWADSRWVGAARYAEYEGWTGTIALENRARYIGDLRDYRKKTYRGESGLYQLPQFGRSLDPDTRVAAIALPLRLGGRCLGVLTLHRISDRAGVRNGFTATEERVLQDAAEGMSSLVAALVSVQHLRWDADVQELHGISDEFAQTLWSPGGEKPEDRLCAQLAQLLGAERVVFFFSSSGSEEDMQGVGACPPDAGPPDEQLFEFYRMKKEAETIRVAWHPPDREDPVAAARQGALQRALVGLKAAGDIGGVLDVRWPDRRTLCDLAVTEYLLKELPAIGKIVGAAYHHHLQGRRREQAVARGEKNTLAIQAMGAMVFQYAHRFDNLLNEMVGLRERLKQKQDAGLALKRLQDILRTGPELVRRPLQMVQNMPNATPQRVRLASLIDPLVAEVRRRVRRGVKVGSKVPGDLFVEVDPAPVAEAFKNVADNAVDAIECKRGPGALTISATADRQAKQAQVVFHDTGVGMAPEDIEAAQQGFWSPAKSTGVGVLLATVLVKAQGGDVKIKSEEGVGTAVTFTLPLWTEEVTNDSTRPGGRRSSKRSRGHETVRRVYSEAGQGAVGYRPA
jgi:signal transduction histidine kinase/GAF domain-containing protein